MAQFGLTITGGTLAHGVPPGHPAPTAAPVDINAASPRLVVLTGIAPLG